MKFSLTFWIADPDGMDNVKSDVMLALWGRVQARGHPGCPIRCAKSASAAARLPSRPVVEVPNG